MHMRWEDLAFLHWPVEARLLEHRLPSGLRLDTFDGGAWLGITPFRMNQVRPAWCPSLPQVSRFPEINVRTYVVADGVPGIWFFSLDAMQRLTVWGARTMLNLPYFYARASIAATGHGITWQSERSVSGWPPGRFCADYRPIGEVYFSRPGQLDYWLSERYCYYTVNRRGRLFRQAINHPQWPLEQAEAEISENTMLEAAALPPVAGPPLVHFAKQLIP